jgi:hypothetical protein
VINGVTTLNIFNDSGRVHLPGNGLEWDEWSEETLTIHDNDPLATSQQVQMRVAYQRGAWHIRLETDNHLKADATHFYLTHLFNAYEGNSPVFSRSWTFKIPRHLV